MFEIARMHVTRTIARIGGGRGQDTLEWALVSGLMALSLLLGFVLFGNQVTALAQGVGNCIDFTSSTARDPGP